jgi:mannose-6-phosphate isomerase-like protein (cupin superfamily)
MDKVNLEEKLNLINEYWSPKILGEVNESYIKVAKLKGEFLWHLHEQEDEMFFVINGQLIIKFRDHETIINDGEFIVIPKGVEHMPVAR